MMKCLYNSLRLMLTALAFVTCRDRDSSPSKESINEIHLKRGNIISCSAGNGQFGSAHFEVTGTEKIKRDFDLAIELLHSFEYDESEKVFAKIIDESPDCAMAYWGVAMCNFHPLWTPPTEAELQKGNKALEIAVSITKASPRESAYINALRKFYGDWQRTDHHTRCVSYEKAMKELRNKYPEDKEAAIFYALALDASANPSDKGFVNQKKAASILNALYTSEPNHPGIIHYLIHTYDYPSLANLGLPFARRYAAVAPASSHALHMPSHIFTRLGLWDEDIQSNLASVASAKCYAEQAGIRGHWDEELHGLDYLVYSYLQKRDNKSAKKQLKYLDSIAEVYPVNFKVAYAFAAIPSRFYLENKYWKEAAGLKLHPSNFPWSKFPWQESIVHFCRLLGAAHLGNVAQANTELGKLHELHDTLVNQKDAYKSAQVLIQINAGNAWIQFAGGKTADGLRQMKIAADMEDGSEKHPVTPGEVLPARELLADMLFQAGMYSDALSSYEAVLKRAPNRFNSLKGARDAAIKARKIQATSL